MKRFRDFRKDQATRDKYADVSLSATDFIYPYFVVEGENVSGSAFIPCIIEKSSNS